MGISYTETSAAFGAFGNVFGGQAPSLPYRSEAEAAESRVVFFERDIDHFWQMIVRVWAALTSELSTGRSAERAESVEHASRELPAAIEMYSIELLAPEDEVEIDNNDVDGVVDILASIVRRVLCNAL
jgi:hypothetical protein